MSLKINEQKTKIYENTASEARNNIRNYKIRDYTFEGVETDLINLNQI